MIEEYYDHYGRRLGWCYSVHGIREKEKRMITTFRGLQVPPGLTKGDVRKINMHHVCAAYEMDGIKCYSAGIPCNNCICGPEHREDLKKLLEMWEKEDMDTKIPELKAGDLVEDKAGNFFWLVDDNVAYRVSTATGGILVQGKITVAPIVPVAVYRSTSDDPYMWVSSMVNTLTRGSANGVYAVWKSQERPVEMTMSELKEKLGYEVKIVGDKK